MDEYRVRLSEAAEAEIDSLFQWLLMFSPVGAGRFRNEMEKALRSLRAMPRRCVLAREDALYDREVRVLIVRSGSSAYRVLFTIFAADELGQDHPGTVQILHVRHGSARPMADRRRRTDGDESERE